MTSSHAVKASSEQPQHAPKSTHLTDSTLHPFLDPDFSATDYLNTTLPHLSVSSRQPHQSTPSIALAELSTQTQTLLSQLSAHTSRLSNALTQLTDEMLRSGSRLAYEVEVLRGETVGLSEALKEGLTADIGRFVRGGLYADAVPNELGKKPNGDARDQQRDDGVVTDTKGTKGEIMLEPDLPPYITQLRTLTLVSKRLETVIKVFGDAMDWTLPPSETSLASSFISVSAPEPGSQLSSQEEKGQEVSKKLRAEVADLLVNTGNDIDDARGIEAARKRVDGLRNLAQVWKGTAEEKARLKLVEELARCVEDRQKVFERDSDERRRRQGTKTERTTITSPRKQDGATTRVGEISETADQGRFGWGGKDGGYGFINQLQKMRSGL
ncbi:hypothetical protein FGG08_006820 [Glutinoglossum americanum]|uniref:Uncharacterized protein n=1 Tax=Glutinoglossum americanum TaxID=1670608 RepID=A0A9P8I6J0_9PEZI|nr:hypothetical protein FGG08_006820 [Glutinoglossum americanum]